MRDPTKEPTFPSIVISTVSVVGIFLAFLFLVINPMLHNIEPCGWCRDKEFQAEHAGEFNFTQRCLDECNITIPEPTLTPECCPCNPVPTARPVPTEINTTAWWNYTVVIGP